MPLTLIGCGKKDGDIETPNSKDAEYTRFEECVDILETAINNLKTNKNDILDGCGIYNQWSHESINDWEVHQTFFESEKGEDSSNYYGSYWLGYEDSEERNTHYTLYSSDNNYEGTKTYVMKEDYEECTINQHAESRSESLTAMAQFYLGRINRYEFSENSVIGWYENFEDKNDFKMVCKYFDDNMSEYTIIEYVVEDSRLVSFDLELYDRGELEYTETCEIKYGIEVDAYDKYDYAWKHIAGLA